MFDEIKDAVNFILSYMYDKIPRRKTNLFGEQLANFVLLKCQNHWDTKNPTNESEYRALLINEQPFAYSDPVFKAASDSVGLDLTEILQLLPIDLTVYINPGNVYYRIGGDGVPSLLSNGPTFNWSFPCPSPPASPFKIKLTESASGSNQTLLGQTAERNQPVFELCGPTDPKLPAGSFAMTRFGTTKKRTTPTHRLVKKNTIQSDMFSRYRF